MKGCSLAVLLFVSVAWLPQATLAAKAALSNDGRTLLVVKTNPGISGESILAVSLPDGGRTSLGTPDSDEQVVAVDYGKNSEIFAATETAICKYSEEMEKWDKLAATLPGTLFSSGCIDRKAQVFVLTANRDDLPKSEKESEEVRFEPVLTYDIKIDRLAQVFCRRLDSVSGITCDSEGQLFFEHDFDLWHGVLIPDEIPDGPRFVLAAYRCAPLAVTETNLGSTSGVGFYQGLATQDFLIVEISRAGGSGYGGLYRIPKPKPLDISGNFPDAVESRYPIYQKVLSEIKYLSGADKATAIIKSIGENDYLVVQFGRLQEYRPDGAPTGLEIEIGE